MKFATIFKTILRFALIVTAVIFMIPAIEQTNMEDYKIGYLLLMSLLICVSVIAWLFYDRLSARIKALEDKEKEVEK